MPVVLSSVAEFIELDKACLVSTLDAEFVVDCIICTGFCRDKACLVSLSVVLSSVAEFIELDKACLVSTLVVEFVNCS
jgi:hypothetical protein